MKTKVVQNIETFIHSRFPAFVWHSDIFSWEPALWTLNSQGRVMRLRRSQKMSECQTKAGNQECMNVWMFWTTFVFMSMLKTYSHTFSLSLSLTLTLSHSHTLSISHSITLDMLNKFCFHLYAQKSLFIRENCNGFFLTAAAAASSPSPVTLEFIELVPS